MVWYDVVWDGMRVWIYGIYGIHGVFTFAMHVRACLCCVYLHFHFGFIFHFSDVTVTAIFA